MNVSIQELGKTHSGIQAQNPHTYSNTYLTIYLMSISGREVWIILHSLCLLNLFIL